MAARPARARPPARGGPVPRRRGRLLAGLRPLGERRLRRARPRVRDRARLHARRPRRADRLRLVLHRRAHDAVDPRETARRAVVLEDRTPTHACRAHLPRLRPSLPADDRWGERWMRDLALYFAGRARSHLPHDASLGRRRPPDWRGSVCSGSQSPAVYSADRRTSGRRSLRLRRGASPCASRPRLRRRAPRFVPVLPAPGRGCVRRRGGIGSSSTGPRSGRAHTGDTTQASRRHRRVARAACLPSGRQRAHCMSHLHARRLVDEGFSGEPSSSRAFTQARWRPAERGRSALVVYAGRHVREKRVRGSCAGLPAHASSARTAARDLRRRARARRSGARRGARSCRRRDVAGRRPEEEVAGALAGGVSGYRFRARGLRPLVVEAAAHGTPSVVVAGPENAAAEFVADGINGAIAASAGPDVSLRRSFASSLPGPRCARRPRAGSQKTLPPAPRRSLELCRKSTAGGGLKTHSSSLRSNTSNPGWATSTVAGLSSCEKQWPVQSIPERPRSRSVAGRAGCLLSSRPSARPSSSAWTSTRG